MHEGRPLQALDDLRGDAAADVDAAGGQGAQGEVAGFGTVEGDEQIEGLTAQRAAPCQGSPRDGGRRVTLLHLRHHILSFGDAAAVAQEAVDITQPRPRQDPFAAHPACSARR